MFEVTLKPQIRQYGKEKEPLVTDDPEVRTLLEKGVSEEAYRFAFGVVASLYSFMGANLARTIAHVNIGWRLLGKAVYPQFHFIFYPGIAHGPFPYITYLAHGHQDSDERHLVGVLALKVSLHLRGAIHDLSKMCSELAPDVALIVDKAQASSGLVVVPEEKEPVAGKEIPRVRPMRGQHPPGSEWFTCDSCGWSNDVTGKPDGAQVTCVCRQPYTIDRSTTE